MVILMSSNNENYANKVVNKIVNLGQCYFGVNESDVNKVFYPIKLDGKNLIFSDISEDNLYDFNSGTKPSLEMILKIGKNENFKTNSIIYLDLGTSVPLVSGSMPYCSEMKKFFTEPLQQRF